MQIFDIGHHLDSALQAPEFHAHGERNPCAFRFKPEYAPAGFKCCDCGAVRLFNIGGVGTGYARVDGNQLCCYECVDKRQLAELAKRPAAFTVYLSSDGRHVITWSGGILGRVHSLGVSRSGWHGAEIARFHVCDAHGQWWQGRGAGRSMVCTLRPMKVPAYAAPTFRNLSTGAAFTFAPSSDGLFRDPLRYRKCGARTYHAIDAAGNAFGPVHRIGTVSAAVRGA